MACEYKVGKRLLTEKQLKDYQESLTIDPKFSPIQLSDKLRQDYYDVLVDSEQDAINSLANKDISTIPVVEDVKLFHYRDEDVPNWSRLNGGVDAAKKAIVKDREVVGTYYSIEESEPTEEELKTKLLSFINTQGFEASTITEFERSQKRNGVEFRVNGFVDLLNKVVKYDESSLPEEAATLARALYVKDDSTILEHVVGTDMYKRVKEEYGKIYKNELDVRKETLDKLIAQQIIAKNKEGIDGRLSTRIGRLWNKFISWIKGNKELVSFIDEMATKIVEGKKIDVQGGVKGVYYQIEPEQFKNSKLLDNFEKELKEVIKVKTARLKIHAAKAIKSFGKVESRRVGELTKDLNNDKVTLGIVSFLNQTETEAKLIAAKFKNLIDNYNDRTTKEKAVLLNQLYKFLEAYKPILEDIRADITFVGLEEKYKSIEDTLDNTLKLIQNMSKQYHKIGTYVFAETLFPFAEKNPNINNVDDLIKMLESTEDISGYRRFFNSMADSTDDVLATVDQLVKRHKETARLKADNVVKDILIADKRLRQGGIDNTEWIFEEGSRNFVDRYNNGKYDDAIQKKRQEVLDKYRLSENKYERHSFLNVFNDFKVKQWLVDNKDVLQPIVDSIKKKNRGAKSEIIRELVWKQVVKNYKQDWAMWHEENSAPISNIEEVVKAKIKDFYESQVYEAARRTDEVVDYLYKLNNGEQVTKMSLTNEELKAKELFEEWLEDRRRFSNFTGNYYYVYELSRPADKYLNPQYDEIQNNPVKKEYYDLIMDIKKQHDKYLPEKFVNIHQAPQIRKDWLERVKTGGVKQLKEELKDTVKLRESDTEFGQLMVDDEGNVIQYVLTDEKGNPVNFLPVHFTNPIKEIKDMSKDASSIMASYVNMAQNYNEMNKIVDVLEIGNEILAQRKVEVGENLLSKTSELFKGSKAVSQQSGGNAYNRYKDYLEMVVYGKEKVKENNRLFDYLGLDQAKVVDAFNKYTAIQGLALNVYSGLNNVVLGNVMNRQEAFAGEYATHKDFLAADKIYWSNIAGVLNDIGNNLTSNKLRLFGETVDVFQDFKERLYNLETDRSRVGKLFNISSLFALQSAGEHMIQYRMALAMANNTKLELNGKEITLWDAMEVKDYKLHIKEGVKKKDGTDFTQDDFIEFGLRLKSINNRLHGIYNSTDRSAIQKWSIGRMMMLFRKFIVPSVNRRFDKKYFHYDSQMEIEGYYRTTAKFMIKLFQEIKAGKLEIASTWKDLTPMERANVIRLTIDIGYSLAAAILIGVLGNLEGDDDDWVYNMASVQVNRLYMDLRFYTSSKEFLRLAQSPAAGVRQMETLSNFLNILDPFGSIVQDKPLLREVQSGKNKGELYFWVTMKKSIPLYHQIEKAFYPNEQLIFYRN